MLGDDSCLVIVDELKELPCKVIINLSFRICWASIWLCRLSILAILISLLGLVAWIVLYKEVALSHFPFLTGEPQTLRVEVRVGLIMTDCHL